MRRGKYHTHFYGFILISMLYLTSMYEIHPKKNGGHYSVPPFELNTCNTMHNQTLTHQ